MISLFKFIVQVRETTELWSPFSDRRFAIGSPPRTPPQEWGSVLSTVPIQTLLRASFPDLTVPAGFCQYGNPFFPLTDGAQCRKLLWVRSSRRGRRWNWIAPGEPEAVRIPSRPSSKTLFPYHLSGCSNLVLPPAPALLEVRYMAASVPNGFERSSAQHFNVNFGWFLAVLFCGRRSRLEQINILRGATIAALVMVIWGG